MMRFLEFGTSGPVVLLLHGGGLSWWSCSKVIDALESNFRVIAAVIDGHGDDGGTFISIEDSASKVVSYIGSKLGGKVFFLGGLSLGAQIVVETLSIRADITEYALIESALVCPIPGIARMAGPTYGLLYGLIEKRWFSKWQAKSMALPDELFEDYYRDSRKMTKESLVNISLSNGRYQIKEGLSHTRAKAMILVGSREIKSMRRSAELLHKAIAGSELVVAQGRRHGETSIAYPTEYLALFHKLTGR